MERLFEICFWIGIIYTTFSVILGNIFDHIGFGHHDADTGGLHGHSGHDFGHAHNHSLEHSHSHEVDAVASLPSYVTSFLKPTVMAVVLTTFGGIGLICLKNNMNIVVTLVIAIIAAFILSYVVHKCVMQPLYKAQNKSLAVKSGQAIGQNGKVLVDIAPDKTGSIHYAVGKVEFQSPAKSMNNSFIGSGEEIVIREIKDNIYYVEKVK